MYVQCRDNSRADLQREEKLEEWEEQEELKEEEEQEEKEELEEKKEEQEEEELQEEEEEAAVGGSWPHTHTSLAKYREGGGTESCMRRRSVQYPRK